MAVYWGGGGDGVRNLSGESEPLIKSLDLSKVRTRTEATYLNKHSCMHTCMYALTYTHVHTRMYAHTYIHMHTCMYEHTHAHIHTPTRLLLSNRSCW